MKHLNVCRTCFRSDVTLCSLVASITPKIEAASNVVLGLWEIYTRILITNDASLPEKICTDCVENIQQTYLFLMKCEKSESQFRLLNPNKEECAQLDDEYVDISQLQTEYLPQYEREQREMCNAFTNANQSATRLAKRSDINLSIQNKRKHCAALKDCKKSARQIINNNESNSIEDTEHPDTTLRVVINGASTVIKQESTCMLNDDTILPILDEITIERKENNKIRSSECLLKSSMHEKPQKYFSQSNHSTQKLTRSLRISGDNSVLNNKLPPKTKHNKAETKNGHLIFKVKEVTDNLEYTVDVTCHGGEKIVKQEPQFDLDADCVLPLLNAIAAETGMEIKCPGCTFKCAASGRLEKHIVDNHILGSMCKICNKEFKCTPLKHCWEHLPSLGYNLNENIKSSKTKRQFLDTIFPFKCEYCVKPFRTKTGYSYHMLAKHRHVEENEKIQECTVCCKCFKSNSALESHMRTHSGEKPYSCKYCGKNFVQKGHMIVHIRRHTGERPYKCMFCPKDFSDKSNFNKHLLFHTGEKPYECGICFQRFQRKSTLDLHYMCHTGERPFQCNICSKKFKQRMLWMEHLKNHKLANKLDGVK